MSAQVQEKGECPSVILQLDPDHFLHYMKRREKREKDDERRREEEEKAARQQEQFDLDFAHAESCAEALLKEEAEKAATELSGTKKTKKSKKKKKSRTSTGAKEEKAEDAAGVDDEAADDVRVAPASIDYQALLVARLREMDLDPALATRMCYDLRDVEEAVDAILAEQYAKPFRSTLNPHAAVFVPATC